MYRSIFGYQLIAGCEYTPSKPPIVSIAFLIPENWLDKNLIISRNIFKHRIQTIKESEL